MVDRVSKIDCCGCEACYNSCSFDAIQMRQDLEGFYYPQINEDKCTECNRCEKVCPALNLIPKSNELQKAYACYNSDEAIRRESTSGGIFSAIAGHFLKQEKGVVYGVKFGEDFQVVYDKATTEKELADFRGSKYIQCRPEKVFTEIKALLENNLRVLFTGLPCQVEALKLFLGKSYPQLYTIDMVCFGVGSPKIWESYLDNFHNREQIQEIRLRDKTEGWKHWKVKFREEGKDSYCERRENLYINSFLSRVNIRPSCYACKFKGLSRASDFTIADCWGIGELNKKMNDDKGLSALLLHSDKAMALFEEIKENIKYEEYDPMVLMEGNWASYSSLEECEIRSSFFSDLETQDFKTVFMNYFNT